MTEIHISAAARELSDRAARRCKANTEEHWDNFGGEFIDDARAALYAVEQATDWRKFHSALCACSELLPNMRDGDSIFDTAKFLSEWIAELTSRAQRTNNT